jgi:rhodanese-related sulfurtransferase
MKKLILTLILCAALSAFVFGAPAINVVMPVYDFGSVFEGIAVAHTFTIKNTGDEILEISGVNASCGCTTAALDNTSIEPGESVALDVLVNTTGFGGTISKSITVYSNDPGSPLFSLRVTGQVMKSDPYHISASDAYYLLYALIDLRPVDEFEAHHFLGAVNLPLDGLSDALAELPHETFIILYDAAGDTVADAALALRTEGFAFVHTLVGGINEWVYQYGLKNILSGSEMYTLPPRVDIDTTDRPKSELLPNELDYLFYLYIDVRSADEYAAGHIIGSVNIPFDELESWIDVLPAGVLLITYDQDGSLGDDAALWMINNDFSNAQSILGGLNEWTRQYGQDYLLPASQ